jgi:adenosylmethionine-8-amino-7-oxononanoate aminotransferase
MSRVKTNVFPRNLAGPLPQAVKAHGVWIEDDRGRRYLDASGGAVVVNLGHGRSEIAEAVSDQILNCHYAHPTMFTTPTVEELAHRLARHAPSGIERFYFMSSGSEAVETALKLARQFHLARGRPEKVRFISRWKSYHGLSLGALAITGRTVFRQPFMPLLTDAVHIPPPYCLRCSYGLSYPDCELRCALALEETIQNLSGKTVAAFVAETISGATLGACPPPPGYWQTVRRICTRHAVFLIQDEVMCGMGRTGRWFASEHYQVVPDIVTIGKGLSGGVLALSAVGVQGEHFDALCSAGGFIHGGTFSHHPVAAAAGCAALKILERENLVKSAEILGRELGTKLRQRLTDHPHVAEIRGLGMLWGIELVEDKASLKPFPREHQVTERVWHKLFERGLIVYKATGLAGKDGDALVVAPPFIVSSIDLDWIVEQIEGALEESF